MADKLSSISILIPTLNAAVVLEKCLASIAKQDYPKNKIEIIIADGGSTDNTLSIVRNFQFFPQSGVPLRGTIFNFQIKIVDNPLKTGEAGKAVALKHAQGELVALIDSDNVLPDENWLKRMVEPFSDPEIIGSEPWEYTYRRGDGFIDRYCALLGMNDPLCYFLGNYDRRSILSGRWTGLRVKEEDKGEWLKISLRSPEIPTIGANGTILRKEIFFAKDTSEVARPHTSDGDPLALSEVEGKGFFRGELAVGDYLCDIDIIAQLASKRPVKFAKVKTGIVHLYCGSNVGKFIRKQKRRVTDYLYYQKIGTRKYPWQKQNKVGLVKFIFSCLTLAPLFYQTLKGYFRKPDLAWFFHPLACWITLLVYSWGMVGGIFKKEELSRTNWGQ